MRQSVNKAFILLDKTLKQREEISHGIQTYKDKDWAGSIGNRTHYNPENLPVKICEENPLLWRTTEPDHNGFFSVFLFKTTEIYRRTSSEHKDEFMATSELRKVLLKNDIAEVGITLEESVRNPTDVVWGYTFGIYKYYIVKDGKTTISNKRSDIRKIYNGKPIEEEEIVIRVKNDDEPEGTFTFDDFDELGKDVYECEIDGQEYLIGDEESIQKYGVELMKDDDCREWLINYLGGIDEIVKDYLNGRSFDLYWHFCHEWEVFASFMDLDKEEWRKNKRVISESNQEGLAGLYLYKRNR